MTLDWAAQTPGGAPARRAGPGAGGAGSGSAPGAAPGVANRLRGRARHAARGQGRAGDGTGGLRSRLTSPAPLTIILQRPPWWPRCVRWVPRLGSLGAGRDRLWVRGVRRARSRRTCRRPRPSSWRPTRACRCRRGTRRLCAPGSEGPGDGPRRVRSSFDVVFGSGRFVGGMATGGTLSSSRLLRGAKNEALERPPAPSSGGRNYPTGRNSRHPCLLVDPPCGFHCAPPIPPTLPRPEALIIPVGLGRKRAREEHASRAARGFRRSHGARRSL